MQQYSFNFPSSCMHSKLQLWPPLNYLEAALILMCLPGGYFIGFKKASNDWSQIEPIYKAPKKTHEEKTEHSSDSSDSSNIKQILSHLFSPPSKREKYYLRL